jgi:V/A-type H+-transporting ATPase subunit I
MKAEFRKLIVLTRESRRYPLTQSMQELGILHIEQTELEIPEEMEDLIHKKNQMQRIIRFLEKVSEEAMDVSPASNLDRSEEELVEELQKIEERVEGYRREIEKLEKKAHHLEPWGDYQYDKFSRLIEQGYNIFLGRVDKRKFNEMDTDGCVVEIINQIGPVIYFVVITEAQTFDNRFESFPLPGLSPTALQQEIRKLNNQQRELKASLQSYLPFLPLLKQYLTKTEDIVALTEAQSNFRSHFEGKLISLSAWFPKSREEEIKTFLEKEQVAWQIKSPENGDNIPVLLKNKKYPRLFEPITKIFELPNYHETDLTPFLAVFYPILFAYCLGDAGYGFVLTVVTIAGYFTFLKASRQMAVLVIGSKRRG